MVQEKIEDSAMTAAYKSVILLLVYEYFWSLCNYVQLTARQL